MFFDKKTFKFTASKEPFYGSLTIFANVA